MKTPTNLDTATKAELDKLAELALGRLFGIMSRPFQDGDHETYEACKAIITAAAERS